MIRPLLLLVLAAFLASASLKAEETSAPVPIGHRGMVQTHPENTLPGFEACLKAGVGFELDVRRTRDGRLVVLHDATLDRTTDGTGKVADISFSDLKKLDAGRKYDPRFAGTRVPELAEVFRLLGQQRRPELPVCIDLKIDDGRVEAEVVNLARGAGVLGQLLFIGTAIEDASVRRRLRAAGAGAHVGCLANRPENLAAALEDRDSDWAYLRFIPSVDEMKAIRAAKKRALLVGPLAAGKEVENWKKAAAVGVDAILTDYPSEMRDILRPRK
jgi:glycerophosphoryl diester phosphodiesterase